MKWFFSFIVSCFFFIHLARAKDIPAHHCEIFIDKVSAQTGLFEAKIITLKIKTLNFRLDGPVNRVGFRYMETIKGSNGFVFQEAHERNATAHEGSDHYFHLDIPVGHDDALMAYVGSFFVETSGGTRYWLNSKEGKDFHIDISTFDWIKAKGAERFMGTQWEEFGHFNPFRCF